MRFAIALVCLMPLVAACGDNAARFIIAPATSAQKVPLRVSSIEVRDVTLPTYAAASEILVEESDGALRPVSKSIWADDPPSAVTAAFARSLDVKSTANVAVEPWPLSGRPMVELTIRVDQMIARADGQFLFSGQFAVTSLTGAVRERLQRFDIAVPLENQNPATVAEATGQAIEVLSDQILALLR